MKSYPILFLFISGIALAQTNQMPAVTLEVPPAASEPAEPTPIAEIEKTTEPTEVPAPKSVIERMEQAKQQEPGLKLERNEPLELAEQLYMDFVRKRLEIGAREMSKELDETMRGDRRTRIGTYFGTINEIELTDEGGNKFFFQYAIIPYLGVGITSDEMVIATKDGPSPQETDGDVEVDSSLMYIFARYPIQIPKTKFTITPFVEFGQADHDIVFNPEPNWASRGNAVTLSNDDGNYTAYGIELTYADRVAIQAYWRTLEISTEGEYTVADGRAPVPVDMRLDTDGFAIGAKVIF